MWKKGIAPLWFRILFGIGFPLAVLAAVLTIYHFGIRIPCPFYQLTGFYCPGCGAGRALTALVHLDIVAAIGYNILFVFTLFVLAYFLFWLYGKVVSGKTVFLFFSVPSFVWKIVLMIVFLFWILRNIPVMPFTLLAP